MSSVLENGPALPESVAGWVPEDELIFVIGKRLPEAEGWEAVIPMFTIVGRGSSIDEAIHEASELLEDYFRVCMRDGLSYDDARRVISPAWFLPLLAATARSAISHRIRHGARRRLRVMRIPARHVFC